MLDPKSTTNKVGRRSKPANKLLSTKERPSMDLRPNRKMSRRDHKFRKAHCTREL